MKVNDKVICVNELFPYKNQYYRPRGVPALGQVCCVESVKAYIGKEYISLLNFPLVNKESGKNGLFDSANFKMLGRVKETNKGEG